ncbi:hypothetical protein SAMN05421780_105251 [Flexibacter flexilis DSM 6793]|uniref:Tetratricopeptide repeat-containing protein n=1 Tax=Flexibacter flexilis DSM 6793 TaxID=927664 RepID=A0A1I1JGF5_9BACT|nr:hypothetical protein [Flexibacter flexilis]SFC45043.1 hypothetical protein SAMN05421780_105251 [Flexibacter flexilis DSM 6793]
MQHLTEELCFKLKSLREFHRAGQEFSLKFGLKVQGKSFAKGWFGHAVENPAIFEKHLASYVPEAMQLADELLAKYRKQKENEPIISMTMKDVEEFIAVSDVEFEKGNVDATLKCYGILTKTMNMEKLSAQNPLLYRDLHFGIAKNLMQHGRAFLHLKPMESINNALEINRYVPKDPLLLMRMRNLKGHIHRQHSPTPEAIKYYQAIAHEIDSFSLGNQKEHWKAMMQHQLAITLAHDQNLLKQPDTATLALQLLAESNRYFDDFADEKWALFTHIRESEIQLLVGNKDKAGAFLDGLEHRPDLLLSLPLSHQSIYLRANTIRYAVTENKENALRYLTSVQAFNEKHNYVGQLAVIQKYQDQLLAKLN